MIWHVVDDLEAAMSYGYIGERIARAFPEMRRIALEVHCSINKSPIHKLKMYYYCGERDEYLSGVFGYKQEQT